MEGFFGSESSSGCESGWTVYLEHSHSNKTHKNNEDGYICKQDSFTYVTDEQEEEDMSMVSDASSGPQHVQEQEDECFKYNNNNNGGAYTNGKMKKIHKDSKFNKKIHDLPLPSFLDDTASSPFFNFSNNNLTVPSKNGSMVENEMIDYSQGYSTTYFKGESAFQDHFGFFHNVSGAQVQQNQLNG
ncbi:protein SOB FIVE-LIKE 5-like isoform X2 [Bidens hawaiensis]|uniref:protein SOB FIVE-LIKE 5-like isoform X2 n=1 Tax=Bidens hawaiensis TaxID=980011 RepID=UPI0040499BEB